MEVLRQNGNRAKGTGYIRGIVAGHTFTLTEHPNPTFNTEYIVLNTQFTIENTAQTSQYKEYSDAHRAPQILNDSQRLSGTWQVTTHFEVQPSTEILRPEFTVRKPVIGGMETALVCGPDSSVAENNIYTDTLGRIKVQFFWDRYGPSNQNSSCWIRVASNWAGNQLGNISVPRIGQEVLVGFLGGDPDLPIVTGSVYNQNNLPPWQLPSQQALSGIRSRELTPSGGNSAAGRSNHLILDDTLEKIQVQLKSDHQSSQLSLGHITRIDNHKGRKDARGEGFELRTDAHGVVRANGLLLTTEPRDKATAHITDMAETVQRLAHARDQHETLAEQAQKFKAQNEEDQLKVAHALKLLNDALQGTPQQDRLFSELEKALLVLATPESILSTAAHNTHQHSGQHHAITAGAHTSISTGKNFLVNANSAIKLFAYELGMQLISASADIDIKALKTSIHLFAKLHITQTADTITLSAKNKISIQGGGSTTTWSASGIASTSSAPFTVHSAGAFFDDVKPGAIPPLPEPPKPGTGQLNLLYQYANMTGIAHSPIHCDRQFRQHNKRHAGQHWQSHGQRPHTWPRERSI